LSKSKTSEKNLYSGTSRCRGELLNLLAAILFLAHHVLAVQRGAATLAPLK
jgi:hypothetical protein